MIWSCPRCYGSLSDHQNFVVCESCTERYECIGGIPDLRIEAPSWIDFESDRAAARDLYTRSEKLSLKDTIRAVYARRSGWSEERIALRTQQVVEGVERRRADVKGWLNECLFTDGFFLDLGCGGGMLTAAASLEGYRGIAIDVSMEWLIVARKMIKEVGGEPILAAAMAESLPLRDGTVKGVISQDVIEHVGDRGRYLSQIDRVIKPGGCAILTTPNRYSLTSEPHVFVWGVGWVPRHWQAKYVQWVSGKEYDFTCLMGSLELNRLLKKHTRTDYTISPGEVPAAEISRFSPLKARLAAYYNKLLNLKVMRWCFLLVGPFFVIKCYRKGA